MEGTKAILVTKTLDEFLSLDKLNQDMLPPEQSRILLTAIAHVIRVMHQHRLQHNCLYPKHIFASQTEHGWNVRLIVLEKLRRCLHRKTAQIRDLSSLSRHLGDSWSITARMRFFKFMSVKHGFLRHQKPCGKRLHTSLGRNVASSSLTTLAILSHFIIKTRYAL